MGRGGDGGEGETWGGDRGEEKDGEGRGKGKPGEGREGGFQ